MDHFEFHLQVTVKSLYLDPELLLPTSCVTNSESLKNRRVCVGKRVM